MPARSSSAFTAAVAAVAVARSVGRNADPAAATEAAKAAAIMVVARNLMATFSVLKC
jgi:hypothetical protein